MFFCGYPPIDVDRLGAYDFEHQEVLVGGLAVHSEQNSVGTFGAHPQGDDVAASARLVPVRIPVQDDAWLWTERKANAR